jgi:hypothetical protein
VHLSFVFQKNFFFVFEVSDFVAKSCYTSCELNIVIIYACYLVIIKLLVKTLNFFYCSYFTLPTLLCQMLQMSAVGSFFFSSLRVVARVNRGHLNPLDSSYFLLLKGFKDFLYSSQDFLLGPLLIPWYPLSVALTTVDWRLPVLQYSWAIELNSTNNDRVKKRSCLLSSASDTSDTVYLTSVLAFHSHSNSPDSLFVDEEMEG